VEAGFAEEGDEGGRYDRIAAGLAYSRSLALLRGAVGPEVDLEGIWSEHMLCEFVEKDVDRTMATMVEEPYVNHVPTCNYCPPPVCIFNYYWLKLRLPILILIFLVGGFRYRRSRL